MQRFHDPSQDPLPQRSTLHEAERARIEQATEAFLAQGGRIEQVGFQMADSYSFVINPSRSPVYAHLFELPKAEPLAAVEPPVPVGLVPVPPARVEPQQDAPVGLVRAWAVLGRTPREMAARLGISEKQLRQICRDHRIQITRQR